MTFLLFLLAFAYFLVGSSGTIPCYRDSGDLIASIHTLGIAHPPGYALYVLSGKLLDHFLPLGNNAYRANVFSALCMAAAAAVLFSLTNKQLSHNSPSPLEGEGRDGGTNKPFHDITPPTPALPLKGGGCALLVCILFVLTPAVTDLGRVAEMYSLAALWAALILLVLSSDLRNKLSLAAFLWGLGLAVHPTLLFLLPLFLLNGKRDIREPVIFFLLGLSIFLFLPVRSAQSPWLNWGDPSHLRNFWRVITRSDYGGLKLHPEQSVFSWTLDDLGIQVSAFSRSFVGEWGWPAILIGAWGFVVALKQSSLRLWTMGMLAAWVISGPAFVVLSNLPIHEMTTLAILQPYLVLSNILWVPFVALGLFGIVSWRGFPDPRGGSWLRVAAGLLIIAGIFYVRPFSWRSHRQDFYAYDYGRNLLRSLPDQAVLYDPDDPTAFTLHALQTTEDRRRDVVLLNFFRTRWGYEQIRQRTPDLLPGGSVSNAQELENIFWTYSIHHRPFFVELPQKLGSIPYRAQGLVYAVAPTEPPDKIRDRAESLFRIYATHGPLRAADTTDFFTQHLVNYYAAAHSNLGMDYASAGDTAHAVEEYKQALVIDPTLTAAYNNWGIIEFEQGHPAGAVQLYQTALRLDPENEGLKRNLELAQAALPKALPGN